MAGVGLSKAAHLILRVKTGEGGVGVLQPPLRAPPNNLRPPCWLKFPLPPSMLGPSLNTGMFSRQSRFKLPHSVDPVLFIFSGRSQPLSLKPSSTS